MCGKNATTNFCNLAIHKVVFFNLRWVKQTGEVKIYIQTKII